MADGVESAEIVESAKAVQEVAKATGKALDGLQSSGKFFDRVFGGLVEDGVGIVADKVKYFRFDRAVKLAEKAEATLERRGLTEDTRSVPPKIALPLIENATLEDDEELHTLWANLLANAMDPNFEIKVNRIHVSLMQELEVIDVRILHAAFQLKSQQFARMPLNEVLFYRDRLATELKVDVGAAELSLLNLMRLGCIKPGVRKLPAKFGEEAMTIYKDTEMFQLSKLGIALFTVISDETGS